MVRGEWRWLSAAKIEKAYSVHISRTLREFPTYDDRLTDIKVFTNNEPASLDAWQKPKPAYIRKLGALGENFHNIKAYLTDAPKVTHKVHWTTATRLLFDVDAHTHLRMVKALVICGDSSESFNTLVSRLISTKAWDKVSLLYNACVVQDMVFLILCGVITSYIVFSDANVPACVRFAVMGFSIRGVLIAGMDLVLQLCVYGVKAGLNHYFTFWNVWTLFSEFVSSYCLCYLMISDVYTEKVHGEKTICNYNNPDQATCAFLQRPVMFFIAVSNKWISLTFQMMCSDALGRTVLPAFYAVMTKDSMQFLQFLFVVVMASYHSYWSLPIPENMPTLNRTDITFSFIKLFKMDILGDVDMLGLEGRKETMDITKEGTTFEGTMGAEPESQRYHDAIIILVGVLAAGVSILLMNVAIGVVSEAYTYNKSNANQIWCHYRSGYTIRMLLRHKFWDERCPWLKEIRWFFSGAGEAKEDRGGQNAKYQEKYGIFIGCHEPWFLDANDTKEALIEIISHEKALEKKMSSLRLNLSQLIQDRTNLQKENEQLKQTGLQTPREDPAGEAACETNAVRTPDNAVPKSTWNKAKGIAVMKGWPRKS